MTEKRHGSANYAVKVVVAKPGAFEPVLSGRALSFLSKLSKRKERRIVDLLFRLAEYPHQPGIMFRWTNMDAEFSTWRRYWPDEAVRELRIVDIEEL